ncbi:MAG TPA: 2-amino-4-hydroxy-6-hydroxymethyldihydropteridine diphosphokinase [Pseudomonadales bacterium]|nr:2-amino-4-hydroxy-6-hydroxymethyldihydropteridine diphosphokinase [Pseudomonadales bacterium]
MAKTRVYIALGSNLGAREAHIREAVVRLGNMAEGGLSLSSLYETPAQDMGDAPAFINAVAGLETSLSPRQLLAALQQIEVAMGRPSDHGHHVSRIIDLDIISFGDLVLHEAGLDLPHPRAHLRGFVLRPLAELDPLLRLPGQTRSVRELADALPPATAVD